MPSRQTRQVECPKTGQGEFVEVQLLSVPCLFPEPARKADCSVLGPQADECSGGCLRSEP